MLISGFMGKENPWNAAQVFWFPASAVGLPKESIHYLAL